MTPTRQPPYSDEAEQGTIGCILLDPDTLDAATEAGLSPASFYVPAHRTLYTAALALQSRDIAPDIVTMTDYLRTTGELDAIGGVSGIDRCIDTAVTPSHAAHYIGIVHRKHTARLIIEACRATETEAYTCDDPDDLRARAESALVNMERTADTQTALDVLDEMEDEMRRGMNGDTVDVALPTYMPGLDVYLEGGMREGYPYFLQGLPSAGKTTLQAGLVLAQLDHGNPVACASLEMTTRQYIEKLAAPYLGVPVSRVIRGKVPVDMDKLGRLRGYLTAGQLQITEDATTIPKLSAWTRRVTEKHGAKLVCLDYMQLMESPGDGIEAQTTALCKGIKRICKRSRIPMLVVVNENRHGTIRGSGQAEYDGAGIWRMERVDAEAATMPPGYEYDTNMECRKNKFGPPGFTWRIRISGATGRVEERA